MIVLRSIQYGMQLQNELLVGPLHRTSTNISEPVRSPISGKNRIQILGIYLNFKLSGFFSGRLYSSSGSASKPAVKNVPCNRSHTFICVQCKLLIVHFFVL